MTIHWLSAIVSNIGEYLCGIWGQDQDDIEAQKRNKEQGELRRKLWEQGLYDLEDGEIFE